MTIGEYEFRFRTVPLLLLALPVPLFLSLGVWQIHRAEYKHTMAEAMVQREHQPPARLHTLQADARSWRFRRVLVHGEYEAAGQFYIENRMIGERTGFHVITPLHIEGSDVRVLINRGWVPAGPGDSIPPAPVPSGVREVSGVAELASAPFLVLASGPDVARTWGKRWPYLNIAQYASTVDHPVEPFVLLEDPKDPDGFVRHWPHWTSKEGMHLGYAIQWFTFAAVSLGFFLRLSISRRRPAA
jgi:surfeit locus 1 family protein